MLSLLELLALLLLLDSMLGSQFKKEIWFGIVSFLQRVAQRTIENDPTLQCSAPISS